MLKFKKRKGDKYIGVLKTLGNCLMTTEICKNLENPKVYN